MTDTQVRNEINYRRSVLVLKRLLQFGLITEEQAKQIDMFSVGENQMIDEISKLDVMTMTPIEALQKLFELQKKARGM